MIEQPLFNSMSTWAAAGVVDEQGGLCDSLMTTAAAILMLHAVSRFTGNTSSGTLQTVVWSDNLQVEI